MAVCCSVSHCVAVCCCSVLLRSHCAAVAVCCKYLDTRESDDNTYIAGVHMFVCCSVLQCVAECCSVLQYVAVCCSVLQCVAVCCSVLQCGAVPACEST